MVTKTRILIGAGAILTAHFWPKATAFSRTADQPLILAARQKTLGNTLYRYEQDSEGWRDYEYGEAPYFRCGKWRVSLGPNQPFAPPPPTWRQHLRGLGHRIDTDEDVQCILAEMSLTPEELDSPLDGFGWEDMWDNFNGPQAKAYHLLKGFDLGSDELELKQAGEVIFEVWQRSKQHIHTRSN